MSQVFTVDLVEGGTGIVAEGDPAYPLCKELQKAGYDRLVLSLSALASGTVKDSMEQDRQGFATIDEECIVRSAAFEDQKARLTGDKPCTHHWVIDAPQPGVKMVHGKCKYCGEEKGHKAHMDEQTGPITFAGPLANTVVMQEWKDRMRWAEELAGTRKRAA